MTTITESLLKKAAIALLAQGYVNVPGDSASEAKPPAFTFSCGQGSDLDQVHLFLPHIVKNQADIAGSLTEFVNHNVLFINGYSSQAFPGEKILPLCAIQDDGLNTTTSFAYLVFKKSEKGVQPTAIWQGPKGGYLFYEAQQALKSAGVTVLTEPDEQTSVAIDVTDFNFSEGDLAGNEQGAEFFEFNQSAAHYYDSSHDKLPEITDCAVLHKTKGSGYVQQEFAQQLEAAFSNIRFTSYSLGDIGRSANEVFKSIDIPASVKSEYERLQQANMTNDQRAKAFYRFQLGYIASLFQHFSNLMFRFRETYNVFIERFGEALILNAIIESIVTNIFAGSLLEESVNPGSDQDMDEMQQDPGSSFFSTVQDCSEVMAKELLYITQLKWRFYGIYSALLQLINDKSDKQLNEVSSLLTSVLPGNDFSAISARKDLIEALNAIFFSISEQLEYLNDRPVDYYQAVIQNNSALKTAILQAELVVSTVRKKFPKLDISKIAIDGRCSDLKEGAPPKVAYAAFLEHSLDQFSVLLEKNSGKTDELSATEQAEFRRFSEDSMSRKELHLNGKEQIWLDRLLGKDKLFLSEEKEAPGEFPKFDGAIIPPGSSPFVSTSTPKSKRREFPTELKAETGGNSESGSEEERRSGKESPIMGVESVEGGERSGIADHDPADLTKVEPSAPPMPKAVEDGSDIEPEIVVESESSEAPTPVKPGEPVAKKEQLDRNDAVAAAESSLTPAGSPVLPRSPDANTTDLDSAVTSPAARTQLDAQHQSSSAKPLKRKLDFERLGAKRPLLGFILGALGLAVLAFTIIVIIAATKGAAIAPLMKLAPWLSKAATPLVNLMTTSYYAAIGFPVIGATVSGVSLTASATQFKPSWRQRLALAFTSKKSASDQAVDSWKRQLHDSRGKSSTSAIAGHLDSAVSKAQPDQPGGEANYDALTAANDQRPASEGTGPDSQPSNVVTMSAQG